MLLIIFEYMIGTLDGGLIGVVMVVAKEVKKFLCWNGWWCSGCRCEFSRLAAEGNGRGVLGLQ